MYIEPELMEKLEELEIKYPNIKTDLIMRWFKEMPEQALMELDEYETEQEYGCHIVTQKQYDYYISKLPSVKWSVDDIVKASGINFDDKAYYKLDFSFLMNYLYCLYGSFLSDASYYVKMTKAMLENPMIDEADETAYKIAKKLK